MKKCWLGLMLIRLHKENRKRPLFVEIACRLPLAFFVSFFVATFSKSISSLLQRCVIAFALFVISFDLISIVKKWQRISKTSCRSSKFCLWSIWQRRKTKKFVNKACLLSRRSWRSRRFWSFWKMRRQLFVFLLWMRERTILHPFYEPHLSPYITSLIRK